MATPEATPVTVAVVALVEPTVANPVLLLLQVPPVVVSVKDIDEPAHTWLGVGPDIAAGFALTTCGLTKKHPPVTV